MEPRKMLAVVESLAAVRTRDNIGALAALAATNKKFRALCLPYLFSHVRWPHPDKHDEESGLHFFPEDLWPLFKRFDLIWPDDWPDAAPPRWGDRYYVGGDYHPRHTDKLATALPRMPSLIAFSICCPFFPPNSLFNALLTCTSVRELRMTDTPLYISMIPKSPPEFVIERLFLIPVAEAPRVGQSPYEARYSSPTLYHSREYRKKYKNDILARYAASAFLFDVGKPTSLTHVQVSGDLCTLDEFAAHDWPRLASLVMTGHPPRQTGTDLVDVISKMPQLKELRLLFAKSIARGDVAMFKVLPAAPEYISAKGNRASLLEQIESLAVSDACQLDRMGYFIAGVERLAILAISDIADPTVAFTKRTLQAMLREISAAGTPAPKTIPPKPQPKHTTHHRNPQQKDEKDKGEKEKAKNTPPEIIYKNHKLKHLRVMLGEAIEPDFCKFLADRFPKLEVLEVEKCGYYDGCDVPPWNAYVDNLKPIRRTLRSLRLGMQFEEQEPQHKAQTFSPIINDDLLLPSPTSSPSSIITTSSSTSSSTSTSTSSSSSLPVTQPSWRTLREKCAHYFAKHLGQLTRIGFEYRKRPGQHRIDDRWLEWEIDRRRFTNEMKLDWLERREERKKKIREEKRKEIRLARIALIKKEKEEREREEREREEREREEKEKAQQQQQQQQQMQVVQESSVMRRTSTRCNTTTTTTTTSSCPSTNTNTPSSISTPSLTTPLSHPTSSSQSSTTSPYYHHGHGHGSGGGYVMMNSPPPMIGDTTTTTTTTHRVSSSISSGGGGGGQGQDYFMNFRTSSTYTPPLPISPPPPSSTTVDTLDFTTIADNNLPPITTLTDVDITPNTTTSNTSSTFSFSSEDEIEIEIDDSEVTVNDEDLWDSSDEDPEGILGIYELRPSWYPFPECWKGRTLWEEEEVADNGGSGDGNGGGIGSDGAGAAGTTTASGTSSSSSDVVTGKDTTAGTGVGVSVNGV